MLTINDLVKQEDADQAARMAAEMPESMFSGRSVLRATTPPPIGSVLHDIGILMMSDVVVGRIREASHVADLFPSGLRLSKRRRGTYPWKTMSSASRLGTLVFSCHLFLHDADAALSIKGAENAFVAKAARMLIVQAGAESRFEIKDPAWVYSIDMGLWSKKFERELTGIPGIYLGT